VVIIRVPSWVKVTKGASHTMTVTSLGNETVYTFTAGDDDITIG
jgi:hypothetical protein